MLKNVNLVNSMTIWYWSVTTSTINALEQIKIMVACSCEQDDFKWNNFAVTSSWWVKAAGWLVCHHPHKFPPQDK